ncbi:hypothetical protein PVAG01_02774 [Phlyctema vagabunda]|uniref:Uncharacterized protein n=1 Tax=Phlyctema vagabunda TaxID=108571 RepID=A0ABR4PRK7_9HELO
MDIAFINQTGSPSKNKSRSTQQQIRKHVMKDIGKARRKPGRPFKQSPFHFTLEVPETLEAPDRNHSPNQTAGLATSTQDSVANSENTASRPDHLSGYTPHNPSSKSPIPYKKDQQHDFVPAVHRFWGGRMDPFIQYPIEMTHDTFRLIDHVFDDRYGNTPPFRDAWFPVGLRDPACFHQVLSNAALNIASLRKNTRAPESFESIVHHTKAVSLVKDRLDDPSKLITDELISSIVGFACYRHGIGDLAGWKLHINGVQELVSLRGGVDVLNTNRLVRLVLFWIDLGGSGTGDTVPNFPLPLVLLPKALPWSPTDPLPPDLQSMSESWRSQFPAQTEIMDIVENISRFSTYLSKAAVETRGEVYSDNGSAPMYLCPILHRLLSLSDEYAIMDIQDQGAVLREVLRLGCILYFAEIRRLCGIMAVMSMKPVEKLRSLLSVLKDHPSVWSNGFESLRPWALAMGGMEATTGEDQDWFLHELSQLPSGTTGNFDDVKGIMWYFEAHEPLFNNFLAGKTPHAGTGPHHKTRHWLQSDAEFLNLIESSDSSLTFPTNSEAS